MKRIMKMMLVGVVLFLSNGVVAQENNKPNEKNNEKEVELTAEERARKKTDVMKKELGLSETQDAEIYEINLTHILEMDKMRAEQKELREKMKAEKEASRNKIKAILTTEQNALLEQKEEEQRAKREEHKKKK